MTLMELIKEALMTIGLCFVLDKVLKCMLMPIVWYRKRMQEIKNNSNGKEEEE